MHLHTFAVIAALTLPALAAAQASDPYVWLEDVGSAKAMAWVESHNAAGAKALESDPRYASNYEAALALAAAKDRIPAPSFTHGAIYNFWQDGDHLRGLWRKTTLANYRNATPNWTTVLDIDALGKAEGKSWVLKGADCLLPAERLCLISLSDGGEDAVEVREFDLDADAFVTGGFHLGRGKHRVAWEDADHLLVASEWTPGDTTPSGYPYIVKRVTRGQPLSAAQEIYRGEKSDGGYGVSPNVLVDGQGRRLALVERPLDTFRHETWVLTDKGVQRLAIPDKASVEDLVDGRVVVRLDEAWDVAGKRFAPGSLVALDLAAVKADPDHPTPALVWAPAARESLGEVAATRDRLIVTTLDNVRGRAWAYRPVAGGAWTRQRLNLPDNLAVGIAAADRWSDLAFIGASGFLSPSALWLADAAAGSLAQVKSLPAKFDASGDVVEQFEATSSDGTKIPYFVVHRRDIRLDGSTPTLLTAYGGFQVSMTPNYSPSVGKLWLERAGPMCWPTSAAAGSSGLLGTKRAWE